MYNISANTIFTGKTLVYLPTCHSTNDYAGSLLAEGNPIEGTLVITPEQTAGKGQRGNSWEAEFNKNLTFSIIFKPLFLQVSNQFYLNIISSLAVRDTVSFFLSSEVKVKWPNDIYLGNRKIAGILIQNSIQKSHIGSSIIGIGLNVNQESFKDKKAISMKTSSSIEFSIDTVLNKLLENLEAYYLKLRDHKYVELQVNYISNLYRYNEKHYFKSGENMFAGTITGLDAGGRLIIESEGEKKSFDFKEVEFVV